MPATRQRSVNTAKERGYTCYSQNFTFKKESHPYDRFVGHDAPNNAFGMVGDICLVTQDLEEGSDTGLRRSKRLIAPGKIHVRESQGWVQITPQFQGVNHTPVTRHPKVPDMRLNYGGLVWAAPSYYTNRKTKKWRTEAFDSEQAMPQCRISANAWLLEEYTRWTSPPISLITPVQDQGQKILGKLMNSKRELPRRPHSGSPILTFPSISHTCIPQFDDCVKDLLALPPPQICAVNLATSAARSGISADQILASIEKASRDDEPWEVSDPLLGTLNLPASPEGLGRFNLQIPNYAEDSNHHWIAKKNLENKYDWHSSLTPSGAITSPHTDYAGSGQHIIHIGGRKLWFLWPPMRGNLQRLNAQRLSESAPELTLEAALDELEGLELLLMEKPMEEFFLPANYIHAVMTLCTSCHAGVQLWGTSQLPATSEMLDQVIKILHDSKPGSLPDGDAAYFKDFLWEFWDNELSQWKNLGEHETPHKDAILLWIENFENRFKELQSLKKV